MKYIAEYTFDGLPYYDPSEDSAETFLISNCGGLDLGAIMNVDHGMIGVDCVRVELGDVSSEAPQTAELVAEIAVDDVDTLKRVVDALETFDGFVEVDDDELDSLREGVDAELLDEIDELAKTLEFYSA